MAGKVDRVDSVHMLTADKHFVLSVVRDIGVHRDDGSEGENFTMKISKVALLL